MLNVSVVAFMFKRHIYFTSYCILITIFDSDFCLQFIHTLDTGIIQSLHELRSNFNCYTHYGKSLQCMCILHKPIYCTVHVVRKLRIMFVHAYVDIMLPGHSTIFSTENKLAFLLVQKTCWVPKVGFVVQTSW